MSVGLLEQNNEGGVFALEKGVAALEQGVFALEKGVLGFDFCFFNARTSS